MLHTKFRGNLSNLFQRRRFLKGCYHIWAWQPSWSHYPDAMNKLSFPLPQNLALNGQAVSEEKIIEHCEQRQRRSISIL